MPNLHAYYYHGNVKAFRQELENVSSSTSSSGGGGGGGKNSGSGVGSAGRSWTLSMLNHGQDFGVRRGDPNERDAFGRTVLHLAASSLTPLAYTFLSILLRHPNLSVNLQDYESGYTALHRALFAGNIKAARDLLTRHDIDTGIKDMEGLSAFDLYNGTVDGTSPPQDVDGTDLYVWGVNRNFALGTGDSSDKTYADRVNLLTQAQSNGKAEPTQRFSHLGVKDVVMSRLHTGVITTESRGNLSICGFGSNGRLGRNVHSQLALTPMSDFPHSISSIALGQDHTLALTSGGYILSWGQNRFSQLGYVIEQPEKPVGMGKDDVDVQISPKRIAGALKKEFVKGVAAGRMTSACWTADALFTWGTNAGHLGYDKATNPVQSVPRKVTALSQPVIDVAFSDYAMVCLLDTFEVLCFHHDANFKIAFSTPRILSDAFPFRPHQSTLKPMIKKVTSCGTTFAALSSIGDVFTFQLPNPLEELSKDVRERHVVVKPQLIWALRKRFTAVKDVALGLDGTVIICTLSGHVFVRQRVKTGSGQLKFRQIPYLQRIVKVATNESGAFAAIRVDAKPTAILLTGKSLEEDFFSLQPHFRRFEHQMTAEDFDREKHKSHLEDDEEDEGSNSVAHDTATAIRMCTILSRWRASDSESLFSWSDPLIGSDLFLQTGDMVIPVHSTILSLRVPALARFLSDSRSKLPGFNRRTTPNGVIVDIGVIHPLSILLLLQYLYSDDVAALWDARVARTIQDKFQSLKLPISQIKSDLQNLAETLDLNPLSTILQSTAKVPLPKKTLKEDLLSFFGKTHQVSPTPTSCDTTLVLADKEVACSSIILRSRCAFFEAMYADSDWTSARQGDDGHVTIKMEHLTWRSMKLVFRFMHGAQEEDLFDYLHQETLDDFLDFVFEVLAAATELLMDRLVLICSRVIIRHCNVFNAASLAVEAAFYQAATLKLSIFDYIIASMETMLESGLLDDMDQDVLQDLCDVIAQKQTSKLFVPRMGLAVIPLMEKHKEWLSLQDIPIPRVRQPYKYRTRSPKLSPVQNFTPTSSKDSRRQSQPHPHSPNVSSPDLPPHKTPVTCSDDIFAMDEDHLTITPPSTASGVQTPRSGRPMTPLDLSGVGSGSKPVWKSRTVEADKMDLRSIMAETAAAKTPTRPSLSQSPSTTSTPSSLLNRIKSSSTVTGPTPSSSFGLPIAKPLTAVKPSSTSTLSSSPATSSWGKIDSPRPSLSAVQASQASHAGTSRLPSQTSPVAQRIGSASKALPVGKSQATPGPSIIRKPSSGPAWGSTSAFAPPPAVSLSPTTQSLSLLAIQQAEQDLIERSKKPAMRSFTEIQAEEKQNEAAKAQEVEFMRWWQEEEARVAGSSGSAAGTKKQGGQSGRKGSAKGKSNGHGNSHVPSSHAEEGPKVLKEKERVKKSLDGATKGKVDAQSHEGQLGSSVQDFGRIRNSAVGSTDIPSSESRMRDNQLDQAVRGGSRGRGGRGGQMRKAPNRGGHTGPPKREGFKPAGPSGVVSSERATQAKVEANESRAEGTPSGLSSSLAKHIGAAEFIPKGFGGS